MMKTLFLDCSMGAAGDMFTATLLELFSNKNEMVEKLNNLGIVGVKFEVKDSIKSGIKGTSVTVKVHGQEEEVCDYDIKSESNHEHSHHKHKHEDEHVHSHHAHTHHHHEYCHNEHHHHGNHEHSHHKHHHVHRGMKEITHILNNLNISEKVKKDVLSVYNLIAEAESISHNIDVSEIHFHEVGAMDAIADITAVCFLLDTLQVDKIIASPINVGSGYVKCAHGILPVPAPATAYILKDTPIYSGRIESELCTPTGAALLKYFVSEFKHMPPLSIKKIGYGMGTKDFEVMNTLRSFLAESESQSDIVYELSCNVDDMTGEEISYAMDKFFEGGAKEVYIIPIIMKKSRPGNLIRVMCTDKDRENLIKLIFKHTTTIGIREIETKRYILDRKIENVKTEFGFINLKKSSGYDVLRKKYEYDDLSKLASDNDISIYEVRQKLYEERE